MFAVRFVPSFDPDDPGSLEQLPDISQWKVGGLGCAATVVVSRHSSHIRSSMFLSTAQHAHRVVGATGTLAARAPENEDAFVNTIVVPQAAFDLVMHAEADAGSRRSKNVTVAAVFKIAGVCMEADRYAQLPARGTETGYSCYIGPALTGQRVVRSDLGEYVAMLYYSWIILSRRLSAVSTAIRPAVDPPKPVEAAPYDPLKKRRSFFMTPGAGMVAVPMESRRPLQRKRPAL
jgi:hypothetical protein